MQCKLLGDLQIYSSYKVQNKLKDGCRHILLERYPDTLLTAPKQIKSEHPNQESNETHNSKQS